METKINKKAITLIALVITIVVLIILAGVAINLTLGNNGIFNKAKQARDNYIIASQVEKNELEDAENYLINYRESSTFKKYDLNQEHVIGEWINGKTIYSKTIFIEQLPNSSSSKDYNHNIENVDEIWLDLNASFLIENSLDNTYYPFPWISNNDNSVIAYITNLDSIAIRIKTDKDRSGVSAYITVNYTKN